MLGQPLENRAAGERYRIGGFVKIAPPAEFGRVHVERIRRQVHESLAHETDDGVTHGAVLAVHGLVLEYRAAHRPVGAAPIARRHEIRHLYAFVGAAARIPRKRTDAVEIVHLHAEDLSGRRERHAGRDAMPARVKVRAEGFQPVGDELDRPAEKQRERHCRQLVAVGVDLQTEAAAHVRRDDAHLRLGQPEVPRQYPLRHVRHLRRLPDRELALGGIEIGEERPRLQRDGGMPRSAKRRLDHAVGPRESGVHAAGIHHALEAQVAAELRMDNRRGGVESGLDIRYGGQFLPLDGEPLNGIFRLRAGVRGHGGHRLALPAGHVDRQRVLRGGAHAGDVREYAHVRLAQRGHVPAGDHARDAGRGRRCGDVDARDARVGMGAPQERRVQHARQADVIDVLAAPGKQTPGIRARQRKRRCMPDGSENLCPI